MLADLSLIKPGLVVTMAELVVDLGLTLAEAGL
jgi:hypothetical protein